MYRKIEEILLLNEGWIQVVADIPSSTPKALIILCHGLTGDRSGPQRILCNWARQLCENGYLVVRFDFRGSGDSSGLFEETTFCSMEEDLKTVINWSYSNFQFSHLVLGGLSMGGLIALKVMNQYSACKALFLFSSDIRDSPTFDLYEDPLSIRGGQFYIHKKFFEERSGLRPTEILLNTRVPCYLIYGQNDDKICRIAKNIKNSEIKINTIEIQNTGHLFESLIARSEAIHHMIHELNQII